MIRILKQGTLAALLLVWLLKVPPAATDIRRLCSPFVDLLRPFIIEQRHLLHTLITRIHSPHALQILIGGIPIDLFPKILLVLGVVNHIITVFLAFFPLTKCFGQAANIRVDYLLIVNLQIQPFLFLRIKPIRNINQPRVDGGCNASFLALMLTGELFLSLRDLPRLHFRMAHGLVLQIQNVLALKRSFDFKLRCLLNLEGFAIIESYVLIAWHLLLLNQ